MNIYILPILFSVITIVLLIKIFIKNNTTGYDEIVSQFLEQEKKANSSFKNFEQLNLEYISANKDILPFKQYNLIDDKHIKLVAKKQQQVEKKISLDMVRLPINMSNNELKIKYGANNFEKITILETRFNNYTRALFEWAQALYNIGQVDDCIKILQECINIKSDITGVYLLMSEIFFQNKNLEGLENLINKIECYNLTLKEKILEDLKEKISLLKDE